MFEKIARFSVRFRWFILVFWILAVPILTANLPNINDVAKNQNSDFLPKNSPSRTAADLESSFQSKNTANNAILVVARPNSRLTADDEAGILKLESSIKRVSGVSQVTDQGISPDGQARQIMIGLNGDAFGQKGFDIAKNLRATMHTNQPAGLETHLTGSFAANIDAANTNQKGRNSTEIYTVILIIVLLLLVFRALLAPLITLLPAGLALAVAQPVIAESTKAGVQVGFITQILLIVLILGAGTDYGLFLVFRVREELRNGLAPKEAVVKALGRVGESITFSAATVISALLALMLASFGIYRGLGPALAIGLAIMLLIALTFLPALLAVLGRAVFWPSKTIKQAPHIGWWGRVADAAIKRPLVMLAAAVVIFGGLSLGILGYQAGGFGNQSAPAGSDSAAGEQLLARHFPAANDNPQLLIFRFREPVWSSLSAVQHTQQQLVDSSLFSAVVGPFNANGFRLTPTELEQLHTSPDASNPASQAVRQFISPDGKTVQFYGVLKAGKPGTSTAMAATPAVRTELDKVASNVGAKQTAIYSNDSVAYDVNHVANSDLKKIIPIVLLIIAGLLAILLRSLVAPWYLIATVGLSYVASLGFAMIVFIHLGHQDGLFFILPFLMFIFCMALGEDYNILVMSRIREEAHGKVTLHEAVTKAIGITGTTVTSAGLILAGTFGVLGLVGGDASVQQIGFGIAFGILLDTFFVRTLLVPSIVALLGHYNWWPSKLYKTKR